MLCVSISWSLYLEGAELLRQIWGYVVQHGVSVLKMVNYLQTQESVDDVDQEKIFSINCPELTQNY